MRAEYTLHPEEVAFFRTYAQEMRGEFQKGLRKELASYPHFVVWRYKLVDRVFKKPLFNPRTYYPASVDNPKSWGTIEQALKALASGYFHGIGFVFSKDDPFTGIDLDHCIEKNGTIAVWAKDIIDTFNTYTEYSPSTNLTEGRAKGGIRMFVEGTTPGGKFGNMEMWSDRHYMTITTRSIGTSPKPIEKRQEELNRLYAQFVPQPTHQENTHEGDTTLWTARPERSIQNTGGVAAARLLALSPEAASDPVLQELLRGDMSRYGNDHHRADWHLLMKLLHWTGDDSALSKAIFLDSPLGQRAKAQEPEGEGRRGKTNYVDRTIDRIRQKRRNPPQQR